MTDRSRKPRDCAIIVALLTVLTGADWPQFRGADNASVTSETDLPTEWTIDDAAWSVSLPGRCVSGPIVTGDQIITTSSSGRRNERLHIWSVAAQSGEIRWHRSMWATGRTLCHPLTSMASPTPATDGTRVYVLFASNDLICLDLDGNVQWIRALGAEHPQTFDDRGLGSSPLLVDDTVVLQMECQGDSFATGVDCRTGKTLWQIPLPTTINWLSPATFPGAGTRLVLLQTTDQLKIVQPRSGNVLARYETPGSAIASPVARDGVIYMPSKGLTALRYEPGAAAPEFLWQEGRLGAQSSSPVVDGGKLYVVRSPNILACGDAQTGKEIWRLRLQGKQFWATPILAGSRLYTASADGIVQVVDVGGDEPQIIGKSEMNEEILGSPAISNGAIYLRGVSHLWKIQNR